MTRQACLVSENGPGKISERGSMFRGDADGPGSCSGQAQAELGLLNTLLSQQRLWALIPPDLY